MIIEMTEAKIGRSMKKCVRRIGLSAFGVELLLCGIPRSLMVPTVGATFVPGLMAGLATPSMTTRTSALRPF